MTPPSLGNKEPEPTQPGKKPEMMFIVLFVVVIIGLIAVAILLQPPAGGGAVTSSHAPLPQPAGQPAQVSSVKPVDFVIRAGSQEKCGLTCRQLTPTITNTGTTTAHNVCISIALFNSGGDLISLNSAPSLKKCIGDIASGASKSEPIVIEADCGFLASKCIRQTLILKTTATCDETTVQFPDRTIAV